LALTRRSTSSSTLFCADEARHHLLDVRDGLTLLCARRRALDRRIFEDEALQTAKTIGEIGGAHHL